MSHPTPLIAAYVGGTLSPAEADLVAAHLAGCDACAAEAAAWEAVAAAARARATAVAPPPPGLFAAVASRLAAPPAPAAAYRARVGSRPVVRLARLLLRQPKLIRWPVWLVSAGLLVVGTVAAAAAPAGATGDLMAVVVPLVAAVAVAGACGGAEDPAAELVAASPTSTRAVLLARLTTVLTAIFLASAVASAALSGLRGGVAAGLLAAWLGPMVLLAAITFALSVLWRPNPAITVALTVWVAQLLASSGVLHHAIDEVVAAAWRTSAPVLVVAVALIAGTVAVMPRLPARPVVR